MIKKTTSRAEKDALEADGWILKGYTTSDTPEGLIENFTFEKTIVDVANDILEQVKDLPQIAKKKGRPAKQ